MVLYSERIKEIREYLKDHSLSDFEREHNITKYDYEGVGFGYQLKENYPLDKNQEEKDNDTQLLDEIEAMAHEL